MSAAQTLQAQFQRALLQDQHPAPGLLAAQGMACFAVYRGAYRARLRAALRDNFSVLAQVMGDDAFDALANAYVQAHPSRHYSIRWFGHLLAAFIAQHEALIAHPAMLDLARMEWALRHAFDAADAKPLQAAALGALAADDWPQLRFMLHPSAQVLALHWAVGPVWHAVQAAQDAAATEEPPALAPPEALEHHLLVWRDGLRTQWKSLNAAEACFVQGLQSGQAFGPLCEELASLVGEEQAAPAAVQILRELLGRGVLSGLQTAAPAPPEHH